MYVCVSLCVCVWRFSAANCIDRGARYIVRSFAGGVSVRARAARVGHWRSSGRAFDQGRASPSRQLYRAVHCHCHRVYYTYVGYCISHDTCVYHHCILYIVVHKVVL
ncbi:Uncharacterized protein FWK35_00011588 [Aphis craccivora]|uniref:Secreted protein n=1 Tax=Aphis craccivora TaxID=307492 RepID=A0A6G0YXN8_APHCR|nr:Uncharacterized protein FWK35_00011588 [Aphis craccivora]